MSIVTNMPSGIHSSYGVFIPTGVLPPEYLEIKAEINTVLLNQDVKDLINKLGNVEKFKEDGTPIEALDIIKWKKSIEEMSRGAWEDLEKKMEIIREDQKNYYGG